MAKYKVGDVAALFSKPKEPTTEAGKRLQSLFKEFHNTKNKYHDKNNQEMDSGKSETENSKNEGISKKNKKRKFSNVLSSESVSEPDHAKKFKKNKEIEKSNNAARTEKKNKFLAGQDFPRSKKSFKIVRNNFEADETYNSDIEQESDSNFKPKIKSKNKKQMSGFIKKSKVKIDSANQSVENKGSKKLYKNQEQDDNDDALLAGEVKDFMSKISSNVKTRDNINNSNVQYFQTNQSNINHGIENQDDLEINGEHSYNSSKNKKKLKKKKNNNIDKDYSQTSNSDANHRIENQSDEKNELTGKLSFNSNKTSLKQDFVRNKNRNLRKEKNSNDNYLQNSELNVSKKEEPDFIKIPGINSDDEDERSHSRMKHSKEDEEDKLKRTLFIGNLPTDTNRKALKTLFSKFGEIENIRYQGVETDKAKIFSEDGFKPKLNAKNYAAESVPGFVVFRDRESAVSALTLSGCLFKGHHISVDFALPAGARKIYNDKRSIFIGNLSFDCKDDSVWEAFSECGPIENVRIVRDKNTGIGKGFGFVQFYTVQGKENALALKDLNIQGRDVRIKAIEKSNNVKKKTNIEHTVKRDSFKSQAIRLKKKNKDSSSRKSVKKIMKKQKKLHEKKKVSSILQKSMQKK